MSSLPSHSARRPKVALVTGANGGLGRWCSLGLARLGAVVILGCRNARRGQAAIDWIHQQVPAARLELLTMDLANLSSVHEAAQELAERHQVLDILVNNAGVMMLPLAMTMDGFEQQFGINYLAHYALTALLFRRLMASDASRVVSVASIVANHGTIQLDDLQGLTSYGRSRAYAQSKLCNLLFGKELARRAAAQGLTLTSVIAHPGFANTGLQRRTGRANLGRVGEVAMIGANLLFAQSAERGAIPLIGAASDPTIDNGAYLGPNGFKELWGRKAALAHTPKAAHDEKLASELWELSAALCGVSFPI
ncbi:oxidoreductase [Ferrimicrobium sp.]|uniref:oxidoreductase n=1 Tax=Ferrimicrobium sp. TaxID=2926050 RepID=UPI00261C3DC9|nr:oxidoreductase [Ferrimicrobium sp.]